MSRIHNVAYLNDGAQLWNFIKHLFSNYPTERCLLCAWILPHALWLLTAANDFSFEWQSESIKVTSGKDKPTTLINQNIAESKKTHLSGTDVVELFSQKQDLGEWKLYYLKEVNDESYRCLCSIIRYFIFIFYRWQSVPAFSDRMTSKRLIQEMLDLSTTSSPLILYYMWHNGAMVGLSH